jgi:tRNA(fMet)-specific endonuclease VapC
VQRAAAERLLKGVDIVEWSFADGIAAAQVRRGLRRRGTSIGEHDLLIAGQAINRGWAVVSANLREFLRVDTLEVFDWTTA